MSTQHKVSRDTKNQDESEYLKFLKGKKDELEEQRPKGKKYELEEQRPKPNTSESSTPKSNELKGNESSIKKVGWLVLAIAITLTIIAIVIVDYLWLGSNIEIGFDVLSPIAIVASAAFFLHEQKRVNEERLERERERRTQAENHEIERQMKEVDSEIQREKDRIDREEDRIVQEKHWEEERIDREEDRIVQEKKQKEREAIRDLITKDSKLYLHINDFQNENPDISNIEKDVALIRRSLVLQAPFNIYKELDPLLDELQNIVFKKFNEKYSELQKFSLKQIMEMTKNGNTSKQEFIIEMAKDLGLYTEKKYMDIFVNAKNFIEEIIKNAKGGKEDAQKKIMDFFEIKNNDNIKKAKDENDEISKEDIIKKAKELCPTTEKESIANFDKAEAFIEEIIKNAKDGKEDAQKKIINYSLPKIENFFNNTKNGGGHYEEFIIDMARSLAPDIQKKCMDNAKKFIEEIIEEAKNGDKGALENLKLSSEVIRKEKVENCGVYLIHAIYNLLYEMGKIAIDEKAMDEEYEKYVLSTMGNGYATIKDFKKKLDYYKCECCNEDGKKEVEPHNA